MGFFALSAPHPRPPQDPGRLGALGPFPIRRLSLYLWAVQSRSAPEAEPVQTTDRGRPYEALRNRLHL